MGSAELKKVPEELEAHLSAKHFVRAVELLNSATITASREDMMEIAALGDIRQYLKGQAVGIVEILVEELHNHLYLKSPYCDGRWAPYVSGQTDLPVVHHGDKQSPDEQNARKFSSMGRLQIDMFRARQAEDHAVLDFDNRHPESDSFLYIQNITHALYTMGKLPYALEMMSQRLPIEIYQMIEKTINEVKARRRSFGFEGIPIKELLRTDAEEDYLEILKDLLWTVFSKWDAMLQAHRVLYDVVNLLQTPSTSKTANGQRISTLYTFADVWQPIEAELKSILHEYLTEGNSADAAERNTSVAQDLFARRSSRERNQSGFSILHAASQDDAIFNHEEQELRDMLQGSVPGLLSEKNERAIAVKQEVSNDSSTGHTRVCRATPFNISVLLQPTMAFLKRAKRIVPNLPAIAPSGLSSFLDTFLEDTFGPQLDKAVSILYEDAVGDADRSVLKISVLTGKTGVFPSTENLLGLIVQLNRLLSKVPYDSQGYSGTILRLIEQYFQKCSASLIAINANDKPDSHLGALKLGAAWAVRKELKEIWQEYDEDISRPMALDDAVAKEIPFLFEVKKSYTIRPDDLLQDPASLDALITLYHSITHFASSIEFLLPTDASRETVLVPDSSEAHATVETLLKSYRGLARTTLLTIRTELRAHILYYLQIALAQGNYNIEEKASEIDSTFSELNADLLAMSAPLSRLSVLDYRKVMAGLASLVNEVLIEDASTITVMTTYGADKLGLGIVALQQNLRNLATDPAEADLSNALKFYQMFALGPSELIDRAASDKIKLSHTRAAKLLVLMYSVNIHRKDVRTRDSVSSARKQLNEHLALLSSKMNAEI